MSRLLFTLLLLVGSLFSFSQKPYFQQHCDYNIEVALDDKNHILRGFETILYTNHSSDTLSSILIHLWPNAYKNDRSSFCEQEVENGKTDFYFSTKNDKGFIDSLNFKVNNESVSMSSYNNHEDIVRLELLQALLPGKSIEISTPFRVVIPLTFSRLGHMNQNYQISQWYPKPAVYDKNGWHPMPYLDQGEFYSEFGNFNVKITIPSNYVVAATGDLQEENEKNFLRSKLVAIDSSIIPRDTTIESATTYKTITFKQSNVHDFAWFADKNFQIEKSIAQLASGRKVECYSYFKPSKHRYYKGSSKSIAQTIEYMSAHIGEYPYQHASVVDGSLIAGEGMEYPNITVIGFISSQQMLQTIIVHEIGHNWFYGMIGTNERDFPWMDESINSLYEKLIVKTLGPDTNATKLERKINNAFEKLNDAFGYLPNAKKNIDQNATLPSTVYTNSNYGAILYQKAPKILEYARAYLGEELFEQKMKQYFSTWCYKHPYPEDFKLLFSDIHGKNLAWLFDEALSSNCKIDFALQSVTQKDGQTIVHANSRTAFKGPIPVMACIDDSIVQTKWIEYPYEDHPAIFSNLTSAVNKYEINQNYIIPEIKISNNFYRKYGAFHKIQTALRIGTGFGISHKNELYVLPSLGYNYYDKFMIGGIVHNIKIPNNKFQVALMPMYSTHTKKIVGSGFISYAIFPRNIAQQITFNLQGRSYHENESHLNIDKSIFLRYIKIKPSIDIEFKKISARSPRSNRLSLAYYFIENNSFAYSFNSIDSLYTPSLGAKLSTHFGRATYTFKNNRTFNPYNYSITVGGNSNFLKANLEANLRVDYFMKEKSFYIRLFAGKFFDFRNSNNALLLQDKYLNATYTANNDFLYDDVYMARNEQKGWLTHQISMREGGFKIQSTLLSNPIGLNNNWLTAINLRTDLPIKLPLKLQLFLDAATYSNAEKLNSSGNKAIMDGGIELHLMKDLLVIYLPLVMSKDFKDYTKSNFPKNRLLNAISFSLNFDKLNWQNTQTFINFLK